MSKRTRPTTAAQAARRRRRHANRSTMNSPEGKAARAAGKVVVPTAKTLAPAAVKPPSPAATKRPAQG